MSRVAVTIAEKTPGERDWYVVAGPDEDVGGQKDNLKELKAKGGDCLALILTQYGVDKRGRIAGAAKPKARKPKD